MPDEKKYRWGKQAIRDAEIRHTDKTVVTTINAGHRYSLLLKLDKERGTAYINGNPFMNASLLIAEIAEKFGRLEVEREAERRRNGRA